MLHILFFSVKKDFTTVNMLSNLKVLEVPILCCVFWKMKLLTKLFNLQTLHVWPLLQINLPGVMCCHQKKMTLLYSFDIALRFMLRNQFFYFFFLTKEILTRSCVMPLRSWTKHQHQAQWMGLCEVNLLENTTLQSVLKGEKSWIQGGGDVDNCSSYVTWFHLPDLGDSQAEAVFLLLVFYKQGMDISKDTSGWNSLSWFRLFENWQVLLPKCPEPQPGIPGSAPDSGGKMPSAEAQGPVLVYFHLLSVLVGLKIQRSKQNVVSGLQAAVV